MDITLTIGTSVFVPHSFSYESGLSIITINPGASRIGVSFGSTLLQCSECNTPIAEITGGSLVIKSKHHSQRHATAIALSDLIGFY